MAMRLAEILATAARTTSGAGSELDTTISDNVDNPGRAYLNVTAVTGDSPTLDVDVVTVVDGADFVLGSFTQASGVGTETILVQGMPENVKAVYTIGGTTPSFTFTVNVCRNHRLPK